MKKGFTLVELIVTLSLILLISSFSFMSLNSFLETSLLFNKYDGLI